MNKEIKTKDEAKVIVEEKINNNWYHPFGHKYRYVMDKNGIYLGGWEIMALIAYDTPRGLYKGSRYLMGRVKNATKKKGTNGSVTTTTRNNGNGATKKNGITGSVNTTTRNNGNGATKKNGTNGSVTTTTRNNRNNRNNGITGSNKPQ